LTPKGNTVLYLQIEPQDVEPFKAFLVKNGWEVVSQDGGQSNFIGWAYIIHLSKTIDTKLAETWLHFSENMSKQESHIELNVIAKNELTNLQKQFNEQT
jgi:hypothetical protein